MVQIMTPIAPKKGKRTRYMVVLRNRSTGAMVTTFHVFGQGATAGDAKFDAQRQAIMVWGDLAFSTDDVIRHPMGNGPKPPVKATRKGYQPPRLPISKAKRSLKLRKGGK